MNNKQEPRLEVYTNRSVLIGPSGSTTFLEGTPSEGAKKRLEAIKKRLEEGFLSQKISACANPGAYSQPISAAHQSNIESLVSSVTSEVGRALIGLTVLQLTVKALAPTQSIRLHKAGGGGPNFSWSEGIPMRVLDKNYITPVLRSANLLNLNADGFMMTRSLAENYPYSHLYKAAIRGGRKDWLEIVEGVEAETLDADAALSLLIRLLINRSDKFKRDVGAALSSVSSVAAQLGSLEAASQFLVSFINQASYSARLLEVAMHSLFQVLEDAGAFEGYLKPLSQMRSANKKHGNVGDIEVLRRRGGLEIIEAWDAKLGKIDLRDELEELSDKLSDHGETERAGFVTDGKATQGVDFTSRIRDLEELHGTEIKVISFAEWIKYQASRTNLLPRELGRQWVMAFAESLGQLRRERAPIDEPCDAWIVELAAFSKSWRP